MDEKRGIIICSIIIVICSVLLLSNQGITGKATECTESWTCTEWNTCLAGDQTRICTDAKNCNTTLSKPAVNQTCIVMKADLSIIELKVYPSAPLAGGEVEITAFVKNEGNVNADFVDIEFYANDASIEKNNIELINAKGTRLSSIKWTATPGKSTMKAKIDTGNRIDEINENNNEATTEIEVTGEMPVQENKTIENETIIPEENKTQEPVQQELPIQEIQETKTSLWNKLVKFLEGLFT